MTLMRFCLVLFLALMVPGVTSAQSADPRARVNAQTEKIVRFGADLSDGATDPDFIVRKLVDERQSAMELEKSLDTKVTDLKKRLEWLGEPMEGESEAVSRQRTVLSADLKSYQAALDQTKRNIAEIARIENEISVSRHESRWSKVMERSASPISTNQVVSAVNEAGNVLPKIGSDLASWYASGNAKNGLFLNLFSILGAIGLATALTFMFRGWVDTQIFAHVPDSGFSMNTSMLLGLLKITIRSLPVFLGGFAIYQAMSVLGLLEGASDAFARTIWLGIAAISVIDSAGRTFLTPRDARFDIARVGTRRGALLRGLFTSMAILLFLDLFIFPQLRTYPLTQNLSLELTAIVTLLMFGFMFALMRTSFWRIENPEDDQNIYAVREGWLKGLRSVFRVVVLALVIALCLGYVKLAHVVAIRVCFAVLAFMGVFALRSGLRALVSWLLSHFGARTPARQSKRKDKDAEFMSLWLELLIDGVMLITAIPLFLLIAGLSWTDLGLLGQRLLSGFQIGGQHFSLMQIVIGVFVFILLMSVTRLFQRVTDRRVLSRMRVDEGVRNSLKMLIGYVGLVIAFMTGIGLIGFDLSNLAIIAGALSVGIGFGLQSIVNNFVSGLILLFERPIKVGDWVVTSSGEGIVKKISVRSTEIETFDRSSILVPNSELISSSVTNWTHKNKLGRVTVPVGVSYSEDPDRIMEILADIPEKVDMILNTPEAQVLFTGFGDSSLDFEIRAFIADVSNSLKARTAIRLEVFKAFKEAGVEIPFPQRDLHLRSAGEDLMKNFKNTDSTPSSMPEE